MQKWITTKSGIRIIPSTSYVKLRNVIHCDGFDDPYSEFYQQTIFDIYQENEVIESMRKSRIVFINDHFMPLWEIKARIFLLDGGYGSSKTSYVILKLLIKCMEEPYFNCYYGRQQKTQARQLHQNFIHELKRNKWDTLFEYSDTPTGHQTITYLGDQSGFGAGNKFTVFGCDDDESLKGWNNPTDVFIDELNQLSFESFAMINSRLRTPGVDPQLYGCFNNCDVTFDHWLYKYVYGNQDSDDPKQQIIIKALKSNRIVKHHSKFTDNNFLNKEKYYEDLAFQAKGDPIRMKQIIDGDWGTTVNSSPFYKSFLYDKHVKKVKYRPDLPIHFTTDENTNPYLPGLVIQTEAIYQDVVKDGRTKKELIKYIRCLKEFPMKNPKNTVVDLASAVKGEYFSHERSFYIYGDATSVKHDVVLGQGRNFFTKLFSELEYFRPELRVPKSNPNVKDRGDFINMVMLINYGGIVIEIDPSCVYLIEDFKNVIENPKMEGVEGGGKQKNGTMVDGVRSVQKYGHFSDAFDYFICQEFEQTFIRFKNGDTSFDVISGGRIVMNGVDHEKKKDNEDIIKNIIDSYHKGNIDLEEIGLSEKELLMQDENEWKEEGEDEEVVFTKRFSKNKMD